MPYVYMYMYVHVHYIHTCPFMYYSCTVHAHLHYNMYMCDRAYKKGCYMYLIFNFLVFHHLVQEANKTWYQGWATTSLQGLQILYALLVNQLKNENFKQTI